MNSGWNLGIIIVVLVISGFAALGVYLIITSLKNKSKAEQSAEWPVAAGEITHGFIHTEGNQDGFFRYIPKVDYVYQVGSQVFDGTNLTFGQGARYKTSDSAEEVIKHYPVGSQVNVYYNPKKPEEAVLDPEAVEFRSGLINGSIIIFAMGLMACLLIGLLRLL